MKSIVTYLDPRDSSPSLTKTVKYLRQLTTALVVLSPLVLADISYAAGRVFFDDFEDGTTNKWSQDDFHNKCAVVTSAADGIAGPYAGSRMVRCNWDGTVDWNAPAVYESLKIISVSYTNEIFYRVRLRVDKNTDRTDGSPLKILRIYYWDGNQSTYRDIFEVVQSGDSLSNRGDGRIITTTYWGGASGDNTSSTSEWHKVEYYFNHATGKIRVWHDGVMIRDDTASFGSQRWLPFYLTSNWSDSHDATNYIYFDNIEIYSDTGSGATGLLSDASISSGSGSQPTLSPPQGLQVIQ